MAANGCLSTSYRFVEQADEEEEDQEKDEETARTEKKSRAAGEGGARFEGAGRVRWKKAKCTVVSFSLAPLSCRLLQLLTQLKPRDSIPSLRRNNTYGRRCATM